MKHQFYQDFPLLCADAFSDVQEKILESLYQQNSKRVLFLSKNCPLAKKYFGGHLHDSWVQSILLGPSKLTVILNEFQTHCFFEALDEILSNDRTHSELAANLKVIFSGASNVQLFKIGFRRKLIPENDFSILNNAEYLCDEIYPTKNQENRFGILFFLKDQDVNMAILTLSFKKISFIENQPIDFKRLFNGSHKRLFEIYWTLRGELKYFCYHIARDFILNEKAQLEYV